MPRPDKRVRWQGNPKSALGFQNKGRKAKGGNRLSSFPDDQPCVGEHISRQGQCVYPDL